MFDNLPSVLPLIRAGRLRSLAVTTGNRAQQLPEIPTIAESGLPGFDTSAWFAVLARKGTPEALRAEIERAAIAALTTPDTREQLRTAGVDVAADGSKSLEKKIADETQMWRDVINKAGIKVE
jgi:tripartite-type tricarboxylate transporter receptor subunit TctC